MRLILSAVVWMLSAVIALVIASETRIGPILVQLSPNHGIHTGDVLAVMGAMAISSLFTLAMWRSRWPEVSSALRQPSAAPASERPGLRLRPRPAVTDGQ